MIADAHHFPVRITVARTAGHRFTVSAQETGKSSRKKKRKFLSGKEESRVAFNLQPHSRPEDGEKLKFQAAETDGWGAKITSHPMADKKRINRRKLANCVENKNCEISVD